jgi:iron(III) transport system ATP-binding protein
MGTRMTVEDLTSGAPSVGVGIEAVNLSFGKTHVLKDIDLEIHPGEFFAFLGPSGCGKTTLLRLIAGFNQAQTGRVLIGGKDVSGLPPWRRDVGMVFQSYALWPHMTVRANVSFGLEERRMPKAEIGRRVEAALDLVGLLDLAERRPSQLSGGQQQRVALARTIVIEPQVLLLDEPLSNLDAKLRIQMRQEILELQRKLDITTIFVTHDQEEANTMCDRIAVMQGGMIQQVGTPLELYDSPANLFVAGFLGTANTLEGVIEEHDGQSVFRSDDGISVPLETPQRGQRTIVFRPQDVRVDDETNAGEITLRGTVRYREFLGSQVRYAVQVGSHTILVEDTHQRGRTTLNEAEAVGLCLDSNQVIVLDR